MFDLKVINSVLDQLEEERGIPREKMIEAIEAALATAYKKEYGKRGQIIRAKFDINTGKTEFYQVKIVVDESRVRMEEEEEEPSDEARGKTEIIKEKQPIEEEVGEKGEEEDERVRFSPEHHILIEDAKKIKKDAALDEELIFPLEPKDDYGRIAAQTAKQVIMQKIREAEKVSLVEEFGERRGEIVSGTVQRIERGNIFVDLGRATGVIPYDEQIPGERYRQAERIRAYLYSVEESQKGTFLRLSRSHPKFLEKLFEMEAPELVSGTVEIKTIAREAGSRSKIAVFSNDEHIDPVGSLVGQRGVRVSTVMSELGGEKIDVIEWSEDPRQFIEDALSPAKILNVTIDEDDKRAVVEVSSDQQSLAIGKGGQNVRLAAKLTGWRIDIQSVQGESIAQTEGEHVEVQETTDEEIKNEVATQNEETDAAAHAEEKAEDEEVKEEPEGKKTPDEAPTEEAEAPKDGEKK